MTNSHFLYNFSFSKRKESDLETKSEIPFSSLIICFSSVFSLIHDGLLSYFSKFSLHIWKVCFAVQSLCLLHAASLHIRAFSLVLCNPWWYIHISVWATLRLVTHSEQVSRAGGLWASPQGDLVRETQISTYTSLSSWAGWIPQTGILWSLVWRVRAWLPAC